MKKLADFKKEIHSCSKCGLCQSVCPIYKITGNDCTVSRGHFIMLSGLIKGELKMSSRINRYLDLCLKCGACSNFCPSGIDIVDIIASAKEEYYKNSLAEKIISFLQIYLINAAKFLSKFHFKNISKKFPKKVVYFEGCGEALRGNKDVIKLLNKCNIEVISPDFKCCGIPFFVRGDFKTYEKFSKHNLKILQKYEGLDIVTTCASCEKTLQKAGFNAKNLFVYLKENNMKLKLKTKTKVTFHKPCNLDDFSPVEWVLENTDNLEYIEMKDFDKCCGLNGISKPLEHTIMSKLFLEKRQNIINSKAKTVLTSCPGCEFTLLINSFNKYKVQDLTHFLGSNLDT